MANEPRSPLAPHTASPRELRDRLDAERRGEPFLVFRGGGVQRIVRLPSGRARITIGRREGNDVALSWDDRVSGLHAALERFGRDWTLVDDGLSRNGSYVNGVRVATRCRLKDSDALRFGDTIVVYRQPTRSGVTRPTAAAQDSPSPHQITDAQRRVLVALCRPARESVFATPATNREIAAELSISVDAVKAHVRLLCERFGIDQLPQNEKRARLASLALEQGLVSPRDLWAAEQLGG